MEPLFWYCNEVLLLTLNFKNHTHATNIEFALNTSSYIKNRLVGSYVHLANLFDNMAIVCKILRRLGLLPILVYHLPKMEVLF